MPNIHSPGREAIFDKTLERVKLWDNDWKEYFAQKFTAEQAYDRPYVLRQALYAANPDYRHGYFYDYKLQSAQEVVQEKFPTLYQHAKFFEGTGGMVLEMVCIGWKYPNIQKAWKKFHEQINHQYGWKAMSQQNWEDLKKQYCQIPDYLWAIGYGKEENIFQPTEADRQLASSFSGAWISRHINTQDFIYPDPWDHEEELGTLTPDQAVSLSEYLVKNWRLDHERERPLALLKISDKGMGQWKVTGIMKENDIKWAEIKQFMQSKDYPPDHKSTTMPLSEDRICKLGTEILSRIRYDTEIAQGIAAGPDSRIYLEIEKHMHYHTCKKSPLVNPATCRTESFATIASQHDADPGWLSGMLAMSFTNRKYPLYHDLRKRIDVAGGQSRLEDHILKRFGTDDQDQDAEMEFRHFLAENNLFTLEDYNQYLAQQKADEKRMEQKDENNRLYEATLKGVALGIQNTNQAGTKSILEKGPDEGPVPTPDRGW